MIRASALRRSPVLVATLLIGVALVLLAGTFASRLTRSGPQPSSIGGPFALVDQDGRPVTQADFLGRPSLVFFGYTHCPDVCPTTLNDMTAMLNTLGRDEKVRALFITVDPERDTPNAMKEYLSSFDPRITGLTGTQAAVTAAERAYRVYAKKIPDPNGVDYSMDHTAVVYLMDADGRFVNALNLEQSPQAAAAEYRQDLQS